LKQAKTPMTAAAWRYFLATENTADDFYACSDECKVRPEAADDLLRFYYFAHDWKEVWRESRAAIVGGLSFPDRRSARAMGGTLQCFRIVYACSC
jgi:hypothetical protein